MAPLFFKLACIQFRYGLIDADNFYELVNISKYCIVMTEYTLDLKNCTEVLF